MKPDLLSFLARLSEWFDAPDLHRLNSEILALYSQGATEAQAAWILRSAHGARICFNEIP